jgi:hypothetical protein
MKSFANLTSFGFSSLMMGIAALASSSANPLISFFVGLIAIVFGVISLRESGQERVERWSAWIGIVVSTVSMIRFIFTRL